jgi:hypothetical protein
VNAIHHGLQAIVFALQHVALTLQASNLRVQPNIPLKQAIVLFV